MALVHVARERRIARKEKSINDDMDFRIQLDDPSATEILTPFDKITGQVQLINKSTRCRVIEVQDVKVWLEGTATTRFQSKVEHFRFLPDETTDLSNVSFDIVRQDDSKEKKSFKVGTHTFPFEIQLNGEILPSSFQSSFGRIQYRLVLYVQIYWDTLLKFSKSILLTTRGCLNLNLDPILNDPFILSKAKEKFFSSRTILKANLVLNRRGFIPGETIGFQMDLENCNCELINLMVVMLIQKNIYTAQKRSKSTTMVLAKQEFHCDSNDAEIHWDCQEGLYIPRNLMPSFTKPNRKCIDVLYYIQFAVDYGGKTQLKGDTMIVLGTTRQEMNSKASESGQGIRRKRSTKGDEVSSLQCFYMTLPQNYTSSSNRRPSLDTFPPPYDEIFEDEWDG